jgi:WD40 repeat protein
MISSVQLDTDNKYICEFSSDGSFIIYGNNNIIKLFDVLSGNVINQYKLDNIQANIVNFKLTPDNKKLLLIICNINKISFLYCLDIKTGTVLNNHIINHTPFSIVISPNSQYYTINDFNNHIIIYNITGEIHRPIFCGSVRIKQFTEDSLGIQVITYIDGQTKLTTYDFDENIINTIENYIDPDDARENINVHDEDPYNYFCSVDNISYLEYNYITNEIVIFDEFNNYMTSGSLIMSNSNKYIISNDFRKCNIITILLVE